MQQHFFEYDTFCSKLSLCESWIKHDSCGWTLLAQNLMIMKDSKYKLQGLKQKNILSLNFFHTFAGFFNTKTIIWMIFHETN